MDFERFGHWIRHLIGSAQPFRVSGCLRISVGLAARCRECDRAIILMSVYMYVRMYVHTYAGRSVCMYVCMYVCVDLLLCLFFLVSQLRSSSSYIGEPRASCLGMPQSSSCSPSPHPRSPLILLSSLVGKRGALSQENGFRENHAFPRIMKGLQGLFNDGKETCCSQPPIWTSKDMVPSQIQRHAGLECVRNRCRTQAGDPQPKTDLVVP